MHRAVAVTVSVALLSMTVLSACSSAGVLPSAGVQTFNMPGGSLTLAPDTRPFTKTIAAPIAEVWHLLPAAYDSLGVPLTTLDPKSHIVGNEGFKARQTLAKTRMSNYFECGTTQVGPNADSYELYLVVMTQLTDAGNGRTKVTTVVNASAKPLQFAQDYSRCSSKEVLEVMIGDILAANLKK